MMAGSAHHTAGKPVSANHKPQPFVDGFANSDSRSRDDFRPRVGRIDDCDLRTANQVRPILGAIHLQRLAQHCRSTREAADVINTASVHHGFDAPQRLYGADQHGRPQCQRCR